LLVDPKFQTKVKNFDFNVKNRIDTYLDVIEILLMSLFVNPWVFNLDVLWLKSFLLFLG
jgi:hypothetical protein